eukprot:scaffold8182_cov110-Skeletonema_dohrnii-CCMP3373.AAC.7
MRNAGVHADVTPERRACTPNAGCARRTPEFTPDSRQKLGDLWRALECFGVHGRARQPSCPCTLKCRVGAAASSELLMCEEVVFHHRTMSMLTC